MKAENETTGHNRTLRITGIPGAEAPLRELCITIGYVSGSNDGAVIDKAVTLDSVVIPAIIEAINRRV